MLKSRNRIIKYLQNLANLLLDFEKRIKHIDYETLTSLFSLIDDRQKNNIIEGFINSRENGNKGQNVFKLVPQNYNKAKIESRVKDVSRFRHLKKRERDYRSLRIKNRLNKLKDTVPGNINYKMIHSLKQGIFIDTEVKKRRKKLRKMGGIRKFKFHFKITFSLLTAF